jgi:hypothetical protein
MSRNLVNIGFDKYISKTDAFLEISKPENVDFLRNGGGFINFVVYQGQLTRTDIFDKSATKIARLDDNEINLFFKHYMKTKDQKIDLINSIIAGLPNKYDPNEIAKLIGITIPLSDRGLCPDFSKLSDPDDIKYIVYGGDIENTKVKIKLTGIRVADEMLAFEKIGVAAAERNSDTFGYVLHHLDDFDPHTGEATMQLVVKEFHNLKVWGSLFKHIGSVKLWEDFYLVKYK